MMDATSCFFHHRCWMTDQSSITAIRINPELSTERCHYRLPPCRRNVLYVHVCTYLRELRWNIFRVRSIGMFQDMNSIKIRLSPGP
ncbi:hypothetical protein I7I50_01611 [Histoplasma capsulatum G186AR]|uniref:Uncharacterized protein n=1 Tax=Ajellomyces capsulatus TaxID=5037 RepID=A0A8H7YEA9_AJECA|nr:hypothetical protein I7I52_11827 [Histoplasma capsulatum]QSS70944.1 hypothetical protein I7I50_01611 [Histoplasma capsulatum G186AR]